MKIEKGLSTHTIHVVYLFVLGYPRLFYIWNYIILKQQEY